MNDEAESRAAACRRLSAEIECRIASVIREHVDDLREGNGTIFVCADPPREGYDECDQDVVVVSSCGEWLSIHEVLFMGDPAEASITIRLRPRVREALEGALRRSKDVS